MHIYARGRHETIAAYMYNEIMLPYAGIIRIRFMGMISAPAIRDTPAIFQIPDRVGDDVITGRPVIFSSLPI